MEGRVIGVSLGKRKGVSKEQFGRAFLLKGHGLVGDSHAGSGIKQVSLLGIESIAERCSPLGIEAGPGDFAENITTQGIDLLSLPLHSLLQMGEALLEVTQHGKELGPGHTFNYKGLCILPDEGIFCRVLESGHVEIGDSIIIKR